MSICIPVHCQATSKHPYLEEEGLAFRAGITTLSGPWKPCDVVHIGFVCQLNPGLP